MKRATFESVEFQKQKRFGWKQKHRVMCMSGESDFLRAPVPRCIPELAGEKSLNRLTV